MTAPKGWTVIGTGPLADSIREQIAKDPDAYRPETWSIEPVGVCECCGNEVFRCTTRHTNWVEGYATHSNVVHPCVDLKTGEPDPNGVVACCCVPPNWGPAHTQRSKPRKRARRRK